MILDQYGKPISSDPSPAIDSNTEKTLAELNRELRKLGPLGKLFGVSNEALVKRLKQEEGKKSREQNLTNSLKRLTSALNLNIAGQFVTGIKEFDTAQRAALGMNQTLATIMGENNAALAGLPGSYKDAALVQVESFRSGFKGYNKDLVALGNRMKITGQNFQLLFSAMAQLRVTGLLSSEATGRLSKRLNATTEKYGISTEILVGAISNLGDALKTTAALGTTEKIVGMQSELIGLLGKGSEGLVTSVLQGLTKADIGADVAAALGGPAVTELRNAATNLGALDTDTFLSLFEKVNVELGGFRRSFVGDGKLRAANLGFWTQIMGEENLQLSLLAEKLSNLTEAERETFKKSQELNKSLGTLRDEVLEPVLRIGAKIVTFASEHTVITKSLIVALISLTAAVTVLKAAMMYKSFNKAGGFAGMGIAKLGPWGIAAAAVVTVGAGIAMQISENKRQTRIAEENKRANENAAKYAKNREERETSFGSSKFASMSSSTLRTILQMQAIMPEFANSVANNMNQQNQKETIRELTKTNLLLQRMAGEMTQ